jgi:cytochrome c-type biogenesis protein CcmH
MMASLAEAAFDSERFADPVAQGRYESLLRAYTCDTCGNASLADAQAPAARNFQQEIRRMIADGRSDDDVRTYLESQFAGQVVPRRGAGPLWIAAIGVVAVGLGAFYRALQQQRRGTRNHEADNATRSTS